MENTLGMKLATTSLPAQALMDIKKATGLSLADIKQRARDDAYIVLCDYTDGAGLQLINSLKMRLRERGVEVRLFIDDQQRTDAYFDNLEGLFRSIDEQYDNAEYWD